MRAAGRPERAHPKWRSDIPAEPVIVRCDLCAATSLPVRKLRKRTTRFRWRRLQAQASHLVREPAALWSLAYDLARHRERSEGFALAVDHDWAWPPPHQRRKASNHPESTESR